MSGTHFDARYSRDMDMTVYQSSKILMFDSFQMLSLF